MQHPMKPIAVVVLLLLVVPIGGLVRAQSSQYRASWWGIAGLGGNNLGSVAGILGASYHDRGTMLTLRTTVNRGDLLGDEINDVGLLYCFPFGTERLHLSAGIGIGGVWGSYGVGPSGSYREGLPFTVGVPVELQAFFRPLRFLGIGGYGFANINSAKSIAGAGLGVQFGRFW